MKVILLVFLFITTDILAAGSVVQALELDLQLCQKTGAQITDIEFLGENESLLTSKSGELFLFGGCGNTEVLVDKFNVKENSELGLLGVAAGPEIDDSAVESSVKASSRHIYLYYSPKLEKGTITRLSVFDFSNGKTLGGNKRQAKIANEKIMLEIEQPFDNHDGGALKIGPDGNIYLGVGDGGSANDPHDNGQNSTTLLGSILRLTPDSESARGYSIPEGNLQQFVAGAAPEILAEGLRNPWKLVFDNSGNLIVADVGQNKIEEISIIPASSIGKRALNLGWRFKEGKACFNPQKNCDKEGLLDPVYQYNRDFGASITGGETLVHNGKEYYLFADYVSGAIGVLDLSSPGELVAQHKMAGSLWTTFGKSPNGEVYIANLGGEIFKISLKGK